MFSQEYEALLWYRLTVFPFGFLLKRSPMSNHEHNFAGQYTIWSTDCFRCKANKTWMFRINDIEAVWKGIYIYIYIYIIIRSWINNHNHGFILDVITHPCHRFNGYLTTVPVDCVNRSSAELFHLNMKYIFSFFLQNWASEVIYHEIQGIDCPTKAVQWLLMAWWHKEQGLQQPSYWPTSAPEGLTYYPYYYNDLIVVSLTLLWLLLSFIQQAMETPSA